MCSKLGVRSAFVWVAMSVMKACLAITVAEEARDAAEDAAKQAAFAADAAAFAAQAAEKAAQAAFTAAELAKQAVDQVQRAYVDFPTSPGKEEEDRKEEGRSAKIAKANHIWERRSNCLTLDLPRI